MSTDLGEAHASVAAMGVAVGLAFALIVIHITPFGIATLINSTLNPEATFLMFVSTCATTFGIGATLTGLVITLIEHDTADL
ncbi:hypothetical protein ACTGJ9_001590 [Bradyrhizobium sp. RDM12]